MPSCEVTHIQERNRMKFRKPLKITDRTSSITNSFVQAVIPWVPPSLSERAEALRMLGMDEDTIVCAYCGGVASDWDHLRPLVRNKRPTGYVSNYKNLVPACGRCNQSKGSKEWRTWIQGKAKGSPASRKVSGLPERIATLENFEAWGNVDPIALSELASSELWSTHWENLRSLEAALHRAQEHAAILKLEIHSNFDSAAGIAPGGRKSFVAPQQQIAIEMCLVT